MSKALYQRYTPLAIVAVWALIYVIEYFFKPALPFMTPVVSNLNNWGVVIAWMMLLYTNIILVTGNARTIMSPKTVSRDRQRSFWFLVAFWSVIGVALAYYPTMEKSDAWNAYDLTIRYSTVGLQLFSISGWTWAEFVRLRRVMSLEGAIFYAVFINQFCSKISSLMYLWPGFGTISVWISAVPHAGAYRAALAAMGVGAVALGVRSFLGKEPGLIEAEVV